MSQVILGLVRLSCPVEFCHLNVSDDVILAGLSAAGSDVKPSETFCDGALK